MYLLLLLVIMVTVHPPIIKYQIALTHVNAIREQYDLEELLNNHLLYNNMNSYQRQEHPEVRKLYQIYNKYTFNSVGRFLMCFVLYFFVLFGFLSLCSFYVYMTYCTYVHHLESEGCALYSIHILARQINLTIQYFYNIYKKKSYELLFLLHSVPFLVFFHIPFLYCRGWLGGRY